MRKTGIGLLAIAILLVLLVLVTIPFLDQKDRQEIQQWAIDNNHQIVNIERHCFSIGPFWYRGKNDRIYEVNLANGQTYWFKMSILSTDIKEQK